MSDKTIEPSDVLNEEVLESLHETAASDSSSGARLQMSDNFLNDVAEIATLLEFPKISKIILSFINCSVVIFISGVVFYVIDSIVSPIAKILVGY